MISQEQLNKYKQSLLAQRESLVGQINEAQRQSFDELTPEVMLDPVDVAAHDREQTVMLSISETERTMLDLVDDALTRIELGSYGTCANCGQEIQTVRLDAVPYARYCRDCQELVERGEIDEIDASL